MILLYAFFVLTFLNAFKDIAIKKWLKDMSAGMMTGLTALIMVCISVPGLIYTGIPEHMELSFLWVVAWGGIFYYFGKFFNFTALSLGDISLISPMKWLVTISVMISSFLLLGEGVTWVQESFLFSWVPTFLISRRHILTSLRRFSHFGEIHDHEYIFLLYFSMDTRLHLIVWGYKEAIYGYGLLRWIVLCS